MENTLTLELNKNNELALPENSKNIFSNIGDAFSNAVNKGRELLPIPEEYKETVKNGLERFDFKDVAKTAAESALRSGMKNLGMKVGTFDSIKGLIEAIKAGDLKKGLSEGIDLAVSVIKIPSNVKTLIKSGKNVILDKAFEDELKTVMKKQQNTISRINKKCDQLEEAINKDDSKTVEKISKTLKSDLEKVAPIEKVIERGKMALNECELYKNKGTALTKDEAEVCQKLAI